MIQKHIAVGVILACFIANSAVAQTRVEGRLGKEIDEYLRRLTGFDFSGALFVMKDGKIVLNKAYGLANKEQNIPNTTDTVFDIGSLSKQFTAAAILRLSAEDKLNVNDSIQKYLPNVPSDKTGITIHQLLSHTSGLARQAGGPTEISRDQMIERIFKRPLSAEPGTQFAYSNAGYVLLAAIVEVASGEPFREYLKKKIFDPAGMLHTGFWGRLAPKVAPSLIARGYDDFGREGSPLDWSGTSWRNLGEGGITSTTGDLYKWHLALSGNAILSREAKEKMWTPVLKGYGYGWWVEKTTRGTTLIYHSGDSDGFGSTFRWFRDENVLVLGLCNIRHDWYPTHIKADEVVPKIIFGEPYTSPPTFIASLPNMMKRVCGTYQLPSGGKLIIQVERGQLQIGAEKQDAVNVLREGDEKSLKARAHLTATTEKLLEAYLKGDMTPLVKVGGNDPDFQKSIGDEIKQVGEGKGPFKSFDVLGTFPAGEPGVQNTIIRLNYEQGHGPYKFRWDSDAIQGTYTKSPALAAITALQPESATSFVGWNIMSWEATKGFKIYLNLRNGKVMGLRIRRDNIEWVARRI